MRKLLLLLAILCGAASAQNLRVDNIALGPKGPIPFATVAVCTQPANTSTTPCTPLANLCSSLSDVTCVSPNPVTADFLGNYHYYVKSAQTPVTEQLYGPVVAAPFVTPDQGTGIVPSGTNTFTGIQTFTGLIQPKNIEGIKYIDTSNSQGWSGTDLAGWVTSAFASCTNSVCTVWVTNGTYTTPSASITVGSSPCSSFPGTQAQVLIFDTNVQFTENFSLKTGCGGYVFQNGPNPFGGTITAGASLGANFMVDVGDGTNVINSGVQGLKLNCNSQTSCGGIRIRGTNDLSFFKNNIVQNYLTNCFDVDGSTVNTGNFPMEENFCAAATGASDGMLFNAVSAGVSLKRNSVVSNSGVQISASAIHIQNNASSPVPFLLWHNHCEKYTDCLLQDGPASSIIETLDGSNGIVNTLHLKSTATGSVVAHELHNNANSGSNPVVLNDVTTTNLGSNNPPAPNGIITEYQWQNGIFEWWADANSPFKHFRQGAGSVFGIGQVINSGTATMTTAAIGTLACGTTVTVAATGVATTDAIIHSFNAAPAANPGELTLNSWPTANNVNFEYCNPTAGSVTPNAATLNWRVVR